MSQDNYYRVLLYIAIALLFAQFFVVAWFIGTHPLPWWSFLALTLGCGFSSSASLLVGHELGHKSSRTDRTAAQVVNGLVGYGHFCIEHNRGHHVHVATPEDSVSARMGESIYKFVLREIPGAFRRGWGLERERLQKLGRPVWSFSNEILSSWLLTAVIAVALVAVFGWIMLPFLVIHHFYAWYGLTQANYVEHYGLLRQKLANGRYELPEPRHSWNTNHIYSNLISFHLQRHSDHHANALRPYQALRDFADLPRLPSGYPGSFGLAAIPPLWFRVMDPKLMQWAGGDIRKVNVDPAKREKLYAKYGAAESGFCDAARTA
jgi:alkane 1-monooxygenase